MWVDVVKEYDYEIFYHPGKSNVVVDVLSHKSAESLVGYMCMRTSIDSLLLDLIRGVHVEGVKKDNWKDERIRGEINRFVTSSRGLLTLCGKVLVQVSGGIRQIVLEEAHKYLFSIPPGATKMYRDFRLSY